VRISYHGTLNTDDPSAFCVMELDTPITAVSSSLEGRVIALEARPAGSSFDQAAADARYLGLGGGTLTGLLTLPNIPPLLPTNATTKSYVDTAVAAMWKRWTGTKAQYDALPTKDPNTLYGITG
jgi:hypothetical protein